MNACACCGSDIDLMEVTLFRHVPSCKRCYESGALANRFLKDMGFDFLGKPREQLELLSTPQSTPKKAVPTSPQAKRIATLFHRRLDTPWSAKEINSYRKIGEIPDEDISAVEAFYAGNWPPKHDVNNLRHNLETLLNNWQSEVDKARRWSKRGTDKKAINYKEDETP